MTQLMSEPTPPLFTHELQSHFGTGLLFTRGSRQKQENEDAVFSIEVENQGVVLAVADGVSGQRSAAEASQILMKKLRQKLRKAKRNLRNHILDGIEAANAAILKKGRGSGSTLAAAEITKDSIRPYLIGDSSVLLVGQKGKLRYRSISHSPVGYALASGLIEEEEAMTHEQSHLLMNAVGGHDLRIEIGPTLSFQELDTLLLCSDGLTDLLPIEKLVEIIRKGEMNEILDQLLASVDQSLQTQPELEDDLSIILFRPS